MRMLVVPYRDFVLQVKASVIAMSCNCYASQLLVIDDENEISWSFHREQLGAPVISLTKHM
jgi:hypothetical protein